MFSLHHHLSGIFCCTTAVVVRRALSKKGKTHLAFGPGKQAKKTMKAATMVNGNQTCANIHEISMVVLRELIMLPMMHNILSHGIHSTLHRVQIIIIVLFVNYKNFTKEKRIMNNLCEAPFCHWRPHPFRVSRPWIETSIS